MAVRPGSSIGDKALLVRQLKRILDEAQRSGIREASVYVKKVKKYEYAILILPKEVCTQLEGLKCDVVDVRSDVVVYRCGAEGVYSVMKQGRGKVCGIMFPVKMRGRVFVELKADRLIVYI